jgi:hypothetical protein
VSWIEIVLSVWLLILTAVVVLLARQLAIVSFRIIRSDQFNSVDVGEDGPELGTEISQSWLTRLGIEDGGTVVVLSATCVTCREVVDGLEGLEPVSHLVFLLSGAGEIADSMRDRLSRVPDVSVVQDRMAETFAEEFSIKSVPFALTVNDGHVVSKGYVYNAAAFLGAVRGGLDLVAKQS